METKIKMLLEEGEKYYPATITDAIGHPETRVTLTDLIYTYDLSLIWPTLGISGSNKYNITQAISILDANLSEDQKIPGVKAQFIDTTGRLEEWQFFGSGYKFSDELGWGRVDSAVLTELQATVFPITVNLNLSQTLIQTKLPYNIDLTWSVFRKGIDVSVDSLKYINGIFTNAVKRTDSIQENAATTINYTFTGTYQGLTDSITKSIKVVDPSFRGVLDIDDPLTSVGISTAIWEGKIQQTPSLLGSKSMTWNGITLNNQRTAFVYPKAFGTLSAIKDGNNFEYLGSYMRIDLNVDEIPYYAYVLKDPVTISGFKQTFS
jgi:hypothetical protein